MFTWNTILKDKTIKIIISKIYLTIPNMSRHKKWYQLHKGGIEVYKSCMLLNFICYQIKLDCYILCKHHDKKTYL
jgi:hypothetical protein